MYLTGEREAGSYGERRLGDAMWAAGVSFELLGDESLLDDVG